MYNKQTNKHTHTFTYPFNHTSQIECGIHPHWIRLVRMMDMWMRVCVCVCVCVLLFKITATALYAQFCVSQKRICCLSDNFIIYPYAVSEYHNLLPQFPCLWFLPLNQFLHKCRKKHLSDERSADFVTMYTNRTSQHSTNFCLSFVVLFNI